MKVIHINVSASGSTGGISRAIGDKIRANGNQYLLLYGINHTDDVDARRINDYFDTHLHDRLSKLTGLQGYFSFFHTISVIQIIRKEKPDIIHLHNIHGNYLCLPLLFRYLARMSFPIVITLHDCWFFTGKCPHYTDIKCEKWKQNCGHCPQLRIYPKSYFFDRTAKCLKDKRKWFGWIERRLTVVAVSDWLKQNAEQSFLNKAQICRIYNGIPTDVFKIINVDPIIDRKYGLCGKYVILGVASVWDPRKGMSDFLKLSMCLDIDECIVMVGLSPKQCENLPKNIVGIPHTESQADLVQLYNRADVLFNASTEETFGMVTAEAMSCGTPVIVYNSTACPEIVTEDTGVIVPPHNITEVNRAARMMKESGFKKTNRFNCRKRALEHFSKEFMAEQYASLYDVVINKSVIN